MSVWPRKDVGRRMMAHPRPTSTNSTPFSLMKSRYRLMWRTAGTAELRASAEKKSTICGRCARLRRMLLSLSSATSKASSVIGASFIVTSSLATKPASAKRIDANGTSKLSGASESGGGSGMAYVSVKLWPRTFQGPTGGLRVSSVVQGVPIISMCWPGVRSCSTQPFSSSCDLRKNTKTYLGCWQGASLVKRNVPSPADVYVKTDLQASSMK
mmetsp:Transcript_90686/g.256909  ORF Transcript_90686/g.256909 Transcript_90686/m.256909 type:complete len:213 (-) Transcript_90686:165-803(-)